VDLCSDGFKLGDAAVIGLRIQHDDLIGANSLT
jgi:hypothetical protein